MHNHTTRTMDRLSSRSRLGPDPFDMATATMEQRRIVGFYEGWKRIHNGIAKLIRNVEGPPQLSSEEHIMLYTTVYNMCSQKPPYDFSRNLYDKCRETIDEFNRSNVLPFVRGNYGEFLLREVVKRMLTLKAFVRHLSHLFSFLERYYIEGRKLSSFNSIALSSFRDMVYVEIRANVTKAFIDLIVKDRAGEKIDKSLLKEVLEIFVEIGMGDIQEYQQDLEIEVLDVTAEYYRSKARKDIEFQSPLEYMLMAEDCMKRERDRVSEYLHSSTEQKLVGRVHYELLARYSNRILEKKYCRDLLRDEKVDDLSRIYRLFHTIPKALDPVADAFKQEITYKATDLAEHAEGVSVQVLVGKFVELHDKYTTYVTVYFSNHRQFLQALQEAFKKCFSETIAGRSSEELLASFCDYMIRKGTIDEDFEEKAEKAIKLSAYISNKDRFDEIYRHKLCRRLLFTRNARYEHENFILARLKEHCHKMLTRKMDKMVEDITLSKDSKMKFKKFLSENSHLNPGIDVEVTLLTKSSWPDFKYFELNLPLEMANCVKVFDKYHTATTLKKENKWIYSLGTCNIICEFEEKDIELIVSTYQAAVLLLFETEDKLSYTEIKTRLNMNLTNKDLGTVLHSLSCRDYEILVKDPKSPKISGNDSFSFNSKFTHEMNKIKFPPIFLY